MFLKEKSLFCFNFFSFQSFSKIGKLFKINDTKCFIFKTIQGICIDFN